MHQKFILLLHKTWRSILHTNIYNNDSKEVDGSNLVYHPINGMSSSTLTNIIRGKRYYPYWTEIGMTFVCSYVQ